LWNLNNSLVFWCNYVYIYIYVYILYWCYNCPQENHVSCITFRTSLRAILRRIIFDATCVSSVGMPTHSFLGLEIFLITRLAEIIYACVLKCVGQIDSTQYRNTNIVPRTLYALFETPGGYGRKNFDEIYDFRFTTTFILVFLCFFVAFFFLFLFSANFLVRRTLKLAQFFYYDTSNNVEKRTA